MKMMITSEKSSQVRMYSQFLSLLDLYSLFVPVVSSGLLKNILFGFYCIQMQIAETGGGV